MVAPAEVVAQCVGGHLQPCARLLHLSGLAPPSPRLKELLQEAHGRFLVTVQESVGLVVLAGVMERQMSATSGRNVDVSAGLVGAPSLVELVRVTPRPREPKHLCTGVVLASVANHASVPLPLGLGGQGDSCLDARGPAPVGR